MKLKTKYSIKKRTKKYSSKPELNCQTCDTGHAPYWI
jgi:hypothetical protein